MGKKKLVIKFIEILDCDKNFVARFNLCDPIKEEEALEILLLTIDWDVPYMVCSIKNNTITLLPESSNMAIGDYWLFKKDLDKIREILENKGYRSPICEIYNKIL